MANGPGPEALELFRRFEVALHGRSENTWEVARMQRVMAFCDELVKERAALRTVANVQPLLDLDALAKEVIKAYAYAPNDEQAEVDCVRAVLTAYVHQ